VAKTLLHTVQNILACGIVIVTFVIFYTHALIYLLDVLRDNKSFNEKASFTVFFLRSLTLLRELTSKALCPLPPLEGSWISQREPSYQFS
jgi:hypothetical protein